MFVIFISYFGEMIGTSAVFLHVFDTRVAEHLGCYRRFVYFCQFSHYLDMLIHWISSVHVLERKGLDSFIKCEKMAILSILISQISLEILW